MAASAGGSAGRIRAKNAAMASEMKRKGITRKTHRCAGCYSIVATEGPSSRYNHLCFRVK